MRRGISDHPLDGMRFFHSHGVYHGPCLVLNQAVIVIHTLRRKNLSPLEIGLRVPNDSIRLATAKGLHQSLP